MAEKWQKTSSPPASGVMKPELRLWMNRMTRERVSSESERKRRWVARRPGSRRGRARGPACPADAGAFPSPSPPSERSRSELPEKADREKGAPIRSISRRIRSAGRDGRSRFRGREKVDVRTEPTRVPPARDAHLAAGAAAAVRAGRPAAVVGTRRIARPRARSGIATAGGRRARAVPAPVGRGILPVALGRVSALGGGRAGGRFVTAHLSSDEARRERCCGVGADW